MELEKIIKEKCTLKEFETVALFKGFEQKDFIFITSNGFLIGKPYFEEKPQVSAYIMITDVINLNSNKKINFENHIFYLAIDQIIAFSPVDRDSFLSQLQS